MTLRGAHVVVRPLALAIVVALAACGGAKTEPTEPMEPTEAQPDEAAKAPTDALADASAAPDAPTATAAAKTPEAERSPMESLARDMIKNGRKIGWSVTKRSIAYGEYWSEPSGRGFHVMFVSEDGKAEQHEVCKAGECDEVLDERVKTEVPKIAEKLSAGSYQPVSSSGWAVDQPELELRGTDMKLSFKSGKLSVVAGGKTKPLGSAPAKSAPVAVFHSKDDKIVVVDFQLDSPGKSDQGFSVLHQLKLFKLP